MFNSIFELETNILRKLFLEDIFPFVLPKIHLTLSSMPLLFFIHEMNVTSKVLSVIFLLQWLLFIHDVSFT